jgi:hypothetical protein
MLVMGMVVAWVIYLAMMPRQTPLVALRITQYSDMLGMDPSAQSAEDLRRFRDVFQDRVGSSRSTSGTNTNVGFWEQERRSEEVGNLAREAITGGLLSSLDQPRFRPGGPRRNVVLFYLSGQGTLNAEGEPCLLASDSRPFAPDTWLPIRELLQQLSDHPRLSGRSGVKKLVLLDVHRWLMHERSGVLYNDFPTALNQVVQDLGDPNLFVINSTSPGEVAWSSPALQGSVFGFFVAEGLNGHADKNEDGTIHLREFSEYLRDAVRSWVERRRGTTQTPQLLSMLEEPPDVPLVHAPQRPTPLAERIETRQGEIEQQLRARVHELAPLTQNYQRLLQQRAYRFAPLAWGQLESRMVQADMLLMAGSAYDVEYQSCVQQIEDLLAQMGQGRPRDGRSLPLQYGLRPDLEEKTGRRLVAWKEKPQLEEWKEPLDHVEGVDLAWRWLVEDDGAGAGAEREKLSTARRLIEMAAPAAGPELVEAHFLRLLDRHAFRQGGAEWLKPALGTRARSEQLAARMDPRAFPWLELTLRDLDQRRREAEDLLYLGTPASLSTARAEYTRLTADHDRLRQQADRLARAFQMRDDIYRIGPSLIRWATWRSQAERSTEPLEQASRLMDDVHSLARQLQPTQTTQPSELESELPPIVDLTDRISATLDRVRDRYYEHCTNLIEQRAADQNTIHSLWQALRVPTLDPRVDRQRLRERYILLLLENQGDLVEANPRRAARVEQGSAEPSFAQRQDEAAVEMLTAMGIHPLVRLMDRRAMQLPAGTLGRLDAIAPLQTAGLTETALRSAHVQYLRQQGAALRESMADSQDTILTLTDQARQAFAGGNEEGVPEAAKRAGGAERLLRSVSGTMANALQMELDQQPTELLQALNERQFYLWQTARTLDDFWGPVTADRAYFFEAAQAYLQMAGSATRRLTPTLVPHRYQGVDLTQLRQQRWEEARRGLLPRASGLTLHEGENLPTHEIQLTPPESFPAGTGYLTVLHPTEAREPVSLVLENQSGDSGGLDDVVRLPLRLAPGRLEPSRVQHQFRRQELPEGSLEAVTFYRGHQWESPVYITSPGFGQQVVVQPAPLQTPTVTVSGPSTRPMAIMLIFDCSASMTDVVDVVDGIERTRLEIAREAVFSVLENLLRQRDVRYHIGLMLYGHRAGTRGSRIEYRPSRRFPQLQGVAPLHPAEDVQIVVDLEREFDEEVMAEISGILNSLQPWGHTPLYYSIKEAETYLNTRFRQRDQVDRRLIVLTDGVNYQYRPGAPAGVITDASALRPTINSLKEKQIQMDILALDIDELTEQEGARELRDMAAATGGKYYDLRATTRVNEALESAINPGEFAIRPVSETSATSYQSFGSTWKPDPWVARRQAFVLSGRGVGREVREHAFELEGGEALQMKLSGDQFVHSRFTPGEFFEEERTRDGTFYLRVPIPRRISGSGIHFQVALQHFPESRFTPRPRHLWAEITPIGSRQDRNARSPLFVYYDLEFLPGYPVPVFQFRATNWPEFANEAELRMWFRMNDDITPNAVFALENAGESDRLSAKELPNVEFEVEVSPARTGSGREVKVWEIHSPEVPVERLYSLRLQMDPPADEWSHRFIPDSRRVLHTFSYSESTSPRRLMVTTRERITDGALALEKPVRLILERR